MRALAHPAWFRPTTSRGAGGRADPPPRPARRHARRAAARARGFFGDLDAPAPSPPPSSSSSPPPPHVIDRPPGRSRLLPAAARAPLRGGEPLWLLQPEHGAAHTHASTHARRARTIRVVLARPIDEHVALAPRFSPAPHCAIQELAVRARSPRTPPREKPRRELREKSNVGPDTIHRLATFIFNLDIPP